MFHNENNADEGIKNRKNCPTNFSIFSMANYNAKYLFFFCVAQHRTGPL